MLTFSEVARRVGLRPSAIPATNRLQRRHDETALYRPAVLQRARQIGFTLDEVRQLFFGFRAGMRPAMRWRKLAQGKFAQLEKLISEIRAIQDVLRRQGKCRCTSLEECGRRIFLDGCRDNPGEPLPTNPRFGR